MKDPKLLVVRLLIRKGASYELHVRLLVGNCCGLCAAYSGGVEPTYKTETWDSMPYLVLLDGVQSCGRMLKYTQKSFSLQASIDVGA